MPYAPALFRGFCAENIAKPDASLVILSFNKVYDEMSWMQSA
jgi:hypothetical protein